MAASEQKPARRERGAIGRLTEAIRVADFIAVLMVAATIMAAFATWRTALVTNKIFNVAERPYLGVQGMRFDAADPKKLSVVIDWRNFSSVGAQDVVIRARQIGDPAGAAPDFAAAKLDAGMVSPMVPHLLRIAITPQNYASALAGESPFSIEFQATYTGAIGRQFCYHERFTYDRESAVFALAGGSPKCDDSDQ